MEKAIKSVSLSTIAKKGVISNVSEVRENTNNYPYVTFLSTRKNETVSTNIYFGQKSALKVSVGSKLSAEQIKNAQVVLSVNADGEERLKLSLGGQNDYTNLASIFDLEEDHTDEIVTLFQNQMSAKPQVVKVPSFGDATDVFESANGAEAFA